MTQSDRTMENAIVDREALLENERRLFNKDYDLHFIKGKTKPKTIGEPYLLQNPLPRAGILLVHGLMAAPEEVREWAEFLYSKGYTVYAPRLAGHGTSAEDLSTRHYGDWMKSVDRGHAILKTCCEKIVIGGFSTGAGLALLQALQKPGHFDAVISISAPLRFKGASSNLVEIVHAWNRIWTKLGIRLWLKEYASNHPDNPHINYDECPIQSIVEVRALMKEVYRALPSLGIPSLIMQGTKDPKVDGQSGKRLFCRIRQTHACYRDIDFHLHGVVRGFVALGVFAEVEKFLDTIFPSPHSLL
ncbi:MAG: alpha/beta fold hydrolase [Pseudomonadota bacterium]